MRKNCCNSWEAVDEVIRSSAEAHVASQSWEAHERDGWRSCAGGIVSLRVACV